VISLLSIITVTNQRSMIARISSISWSLSSQRIIWIFECCSTLLPISLLALLNLWENIEQTRSFFQKFLIQVDVGIQKLFVEFFSAVEFRLMLMNFSFWCILKMFWSIKNRCRFGVCFQNDQKAEIQKMILFDFEISQCAGKIPGRFSELLPSCFF